MSRSFVSLVVALGAALPAAGTTLAPGFYPLPPVSGYALSAPTAVSGDGSVVVGTSNQPASGPAVATRWTNGGPPVQLSPYITVAGVSNDGSAMLVAGPEGWFRWAPPAAAQALIAPTGYTNPTAAALSADGTTAVGQTSSGRATRWTTPQTGQTLGTLPGGSYSVATAVNGDGSRVVGYGGSPNEGGERAFLWSSAGMQSLGVLPGMFTSRAGAISADGQVVVGTAFNVGLNSYRAFRWTQGPGIAQLVDLQGGGNSAALAASADGSVIVGFGAGTDSSSIAAAWFAGQPGATDLNALFSSLGYNIAGWQLYQATGVSADGRTIAGLGVFNGQSRAWVAAIPAAGPSGLALIGAFALGRRRR